MIAQGTTKTIDKKYAVEMHKRLGSGSYGQVYEAYKLDDPNTILACKLISKQKILNKISQSNVEDKEKAINYIIKSTKNEITICQKILHPNIVKFVYCSETSNNIYLFMEYCEGGDIGRLINEKGSLQGVQAIKLIRSIVSAAASLYDHNILHRDIKPQNILLCKGEPKLGDFGFSKQSKKDNKDKQQTGTNIGTLLYMAPQLIFEENPHYSIKCDVWSVGVVMYFILYGNIPWGNVSSLQELKLKLKQPILFPQKDGVPGKLKNCISKALLFNESQRISIKKMQQEIEELWESQMDVE